MAKCILCSNRPNNKQATTCKVGYVYSKSIENIEFDCDEFNPELVKAEPFAEDIPKVVELSNNKQIRKPMSQKVDIIKGKKVKKSNNGKKMSHKLDISGRILNCRLPLTEIAKLFKVSRKTIERWIPEKLKSDKLKNVVKLYNELKVRKK